MATIAEVHAEYDADVAKAASIKAQLLAIESRTTGPRLGQIVRAGEVDAPGHHPNGTIYQEYGIDPPGVFGSAADRALWNKLWPQYPPLIDEIRTLYGILHPDKGLTPLEEILSVVGLAAAGVAAAAIGAGLGAAAAGTAATASTAAVGAAPTAAELGTTAAVATTPIVTAGSGVAAAATGATVAGATTAGSVASSVGSTVSNLTGSSTLGSIASNVVSGASGLITDLKDIFGPVVTYAQSVLNDVEAIDKDYIVPFTTTISKDYTAITGLVNEVHTLSQSGIQGILAIPSAISSALTSIDAANQRLAQMYAQANQNIASNTLVPGIGTAIASPIADIHGVLAGAFSSGVTEVGAVSKDTIDETVFATADLVGKFNEYLQSVAGAGWLGRLIAILLQGWTAALGFLGSIEHILDYGRQAGRLENRVTPLDIASVVKAWWRGQLDSNAVETELGRHGLDASRQQLLHDLEQWLPSPTDAIRMFYRGIITAEEARAALYKQGLSDNDITALMDAFLRPVDAREAIVTNGRIAAGQAGFLQQSLTSAAPDQYKLLYSADERNPDQAQFDWAGHWDIQGMDWWLRALWRGEVSQQEFELAAEAHNIPPELVPHLNAVSAGVIELWMIPDMIATGVFTEAEATQYLRYLGHTPQSVAYMLKYGQIKQAQGAATDALGLGGISLGLAADMYDDGIINDSEYLDILEAHKMTPQAASLMLKLTQQRSALATRKEIAKGLVKQVDVGLITVQAMQTQMYQQGYTQQEVDNYTAQAEAGQIAKAKFPTEAQIKAFHAAGILSDEDALNAMQVAGWTPEWAQAFLTLWRTSGKTQANA